MFIIFFFKQKTAYEMRISDWSSDVCSSDLLRSRPQEEDGGDGELRQDQQVGQGRGPEDDALFHESYRPVWSLRRGGPRRRGLIVGALEAAQQPVPPLDRGIERLLGRLGAGPAGLQLLVDEAADLVEAVEEIGRAHG